MDQIAQDIIKGLEEHENVPASQFSQVDEKICNLKHIVENVKEHEVWKKPFVFRFYFF